MTIAHLKNNEEKVYISPQNAQREINRRRNLENFPVIMKKIKSELWKNIEPPLPTPNGGKPNAYYWRNIASSNFENWKFFHVSKLDGFKPCSIEYTKDRFSTRNQTKIDLCRLTFAEGSEYKLVNSFQEIENKSFEEITTTQGEPLVEFHHRIREAVFSAEDAKAYIDISNWIKSQGEKAINNYAAFLALFINRVLYDNFHTPSSQKAEEVKQLDKFRNEVFLPAWRKVEEITGMQPLIIRLPSKPELSWYPELIKDKIKFCPRGY